MTKAAKELLVSQPAVTKSIKTLESQLGGTLFIRSNKGLELTEEGKNFYNKIEIAFSFISDAENSFGDFKSMKLGEVKIGVSSVLTKVLLLDVIKEYRDKYPGVKISITNGLTSDLIHSLNKGKLDFVIYNEGDVEEKNVDIKKVTTLSHSFVYNKEYYNLSDVTSIDELKKYPLILQKTDSNTRKLLNSYLEKNDVELNPQIEVVSQDLVCEFASKGIGVGYVLEDLAKERYPELERVNIDDKIKTDIYIATNKSLSPTFAAEKFLKLLK